MQNLNLKNKKRAEINSKIVIVLAVVVVVLVAFAAWSFLGSNNSEKSTQTERTYSEISVNVLPSPNESFSENLIPSP